MKSMNRGGFLRNSISAATAFMVLSQSTTPAAQNEIVLAIMGVEEVRSCRAL
jgi:hypothetical protein